MNKLRLSNYTAKDRFMSHKAIYIFQEFCVTMDINEDHLAATIINLVASYLVSLKLTCIDGDLIDDFQEELSKEYLDILHKYKDVIEQNND